jgi:hypothetical protein
MTLVWASGYNGIPDPDAQVYIAAVEAADGQTLEEPVQFAIHEFVAGCKYDGIWDAIKASCIFAGARTLSGALVPLKGTAPTNNNFVSGDYNRETGLVGDGSTKYLDSNRNCNADPQDSHHLSVYATTAPTSTSSRFPTYIGAGIVDTGATAFGRTQNNGQLFGRNRSSSFDFLGGGSDIGLIGASRSTSTGFVFRRSTTNTDYTRTSQTPLNANLFVYNTNASGPAFAYYSNARLAFYSIGESIDLEKLDTRVTRLMNLITYFLTSGLPDLSTMDWDAAAYIGGAYRAGGTLS